MAKKKETEEVKALFSKEQLVASKKFKDHSDLVNALLEDDKTYSLEEVEMMVEKYMKGKVN
jgi:hypothetical protein